MPSRTTPPRGRTRRPSPRRVPCAEALESRRLLSGGPISLTVPPVVEFIGRRANTKVATFADSDPTATAADFSATIYWGDGGSTAGVVRASGGGFVVLGDHTPATFPEYPIGSTTVRVDDTRGTAEATASAPSVDSLSFTPTGSVISDASAGTPGGAPRGIILGPDGRELWYAEPGTGMIASITTAGVVKEYTLPGPDPAALGVSGLAAGPDGNVWFTEAAADRIGRITPAGVVTEFSAGITPGAGPSGIVASPSDGDLWFAERGGDAIGRITPDGVVTEFSAGLPPGEDPFAVAAGPGGDVWFLGAGDHPIGRITPDGAVTEFDGVTGPGITAITLGPDGALWFADAGPGAIGRIDPATSSVEEFSDGEIVDPASIAPGPDGNLWFTEPSVDRVDRITPDGQITRFSDGMIPGSHPAEIAAGPDGNLYFAEPGGDRIGLVVLPQESVVATPAPTTPTISSEAYLFNATLGTFREASGFAVEGNFQVTIDPGNGQAAVPGSAYAVSPGVFEISSDYYYPHSGDYTITITISNEAGTAGVIREPITVGATIYAYLEFGEVTQGHTFNATIARFYDTDAGGDPSQFAATIDWGDGTTSPGVIAGFGYYQHPEYHVGGSHVYANAGRYSVTVSVSSVAGPAPTVEAVPDPDYVTGPGPGTFENMGVDAAVPLETVNEIPAPSPLGNPVGIAVGPDGAIWYTEPGTDQIGRVTTDGVATQFSLGPRGPFPYLDSPQGIAAGPDGNLWFSDLAAGRIGRITLQGVVTYFSAGITGKAALGGQDQAIGAIVAGPDGNLWFTEDDQIGRITPAGVVTEFPDDRLKGYGASSIAAGPDGNLWFVEQGGVGRITPAGVITHFTAGFSEPVDVITAGPDGNLYFIEGRGVGRITPAGVVTEFGQAPVPGPFLSDITTGPDGELWFTETIQGGIGRVSTSGVYDLDSGEGGAYEREVSSGITDNIEATGMVAGPDGNLYFAESSSYDGNQIGQVILPQASVGIVPAAPTPAVAGIASTAVVATFTDASPLANPKNFSATIDYGDGSAPVPGTITADGRGGFIVSGTHALTTAGGGPGIVTIFNEAGEASASFPVAVRSPAITGTGRTLDATAGVPVAEDLAGFGDEIPGLTPGDYRARVDWGDGTEPTAGTVIASASGASLPFEVIGGHAYASAGDYRVTVTIVADAGPTRSVAIVDGATVASPPPPPSPPISNPPTQSRPTPPPVVVHPTPPPIVVHPTPPPVVAPPTSYVVSDADDSGPGSLRQAILDADGHPGLPIVFAIPDIRGGHPVETIRLLSPLPVLDGSTVVDGTSQAPFEGVGYSTPLIEVDGRGLAAGAAGLVFGGEGRGGRVEGLSIFGFSGPGIDLEAPGVVVVGNYLGLRADGADLGPIAAPSPTADGVLVRGAGSIIGELGPHLGDVISGNAGQGVDVVGPAATSVGIFGDIIGLDPSGAAALGNGFNGITVTAGARGEFIGPGDLISGNGAEGIALVGSAGDLVVGDAIGTDAAVGRAIGNGLNGILVAGGSSGVSIGGATAAGPDNFLSGNGGSGVLIRGGSSETEVRYNLIGTNLHGDSAIGNGRAGVEIDDSPANLVGPGDLISGNSGDGVRIAGAGSAGNLVAGDLVGTDLAGARALGNGSAGVFLDGAPANTVGGTALGQTDVISGNGTVGVRVAGAGAAGNLVESDLIGTDQAGTGPIGVQGAGVSIEDAPGTVLGGASPLAALVVSGNRGDGVRVAGAGSSGTLIEGDRVGTDILGGSAVENGGEGVSLSGPSARVLDDILAGDGLDGLLVSGPLALGTEVEGNAIGVGSGGRALGNAGYGIRVAGGSRLAPGPGNVLANNGLGPRHGDFARNAPAVRPTVQVTERRLVPRPGP